ncbi:MAG: hypothetical protein ACKVWV_19235 [Planctomycetota bacterium]
MTRTSRTFGFAALVAAIVVVLLLVPTKELSDEPAPSPADAISAAAGEIERASSQLSSEAAHETEPQRATASTADSLRLHVVDFDGKPRASATVVVARYEKVLAHGVTDANGNTSLAASADAAVVVVLDEKLVPLARVRLDHATGEQQIALPERVTLHGRVLVDEQVPTRSLHLKFWGQAEEGPPPYLPEFVYEQLGWPKEVRTATIKIDTDGAGRFRFDGVPPSWQGWVTPEPMFLPQGGGGRVNRRVLDVRNELLIRLKSYAVVTGRIVMEETHEPVPGAKGSFERDCPQDQTWDDVSCDDDGRFWLRLQCKPVTKLKFSFAVESVGRVSRELTDVPAEGLDLGDVPLESAFDVTMRVQNAAGEPIAGAGAFLAENQQVASEETKDDGLCSLRSLPLSTRQVVVVAFGYYDRFVPVDPALVSAAPLEVVMEPMPMLEISGRAAQGGLLQGLVVRVRTWDPEPFVTKSGRSKWTEEVHVDGANGSSRRSFTGTDSDEPAIDARLRVQESGVVRIAGFRPRDRTRVAVEDGVGTELGARELTPGELDDGEVVEFVVDRMLRTLELEIVDAQEKPVRSAFVYGIPRRNLLASARADGRATLRSIGTDRIDLRIVAQGFANTTLFGMVLDAPVVSRRIVLEPATTVRVFALDARGRAVVAEQLSVRQGSDVVGRVTRCDGEPCFVVEDLGADAVELVLFIGGRRFTQMHDPQTGTAKIAVPDHGGLRVEFEPWLAPPALFQLKVQDEHGPTTLFQNVVPEERTEFVNVPVLFPGSYTVELLEIDATSGEANRVVARAEHVVIVANEWSAVRLTKP